MKNIKEKFIELCSKIEEASSMKNNLDVIKNNRAALALIKVFKYFEEHRDEAEQILSELLEHENYFVHSNAASHCLALGVRTEQALAILREVAQNPTKRSRMNAKGVLMVYEKQGYLTMYRGQKIYHRKL
jgi:HEAT repeat protein